MYKMQLSGCAWVLFGQCLVLLLPVLKLLEVPGIADWSWLSVLAPLWGPGVLLAIILAVEWTVGAVKKLLVGYHPGEMAQSRLSKVNA
jgi:hypothetical protein